MELQNEKNAPSIDVKMEESWKAILRDEFEKPYFSQLINFIKSEKQAGQTIYPSGANIFRAFELTPFDDVRVVILGQDPYHGPGQAHGLSFSVPFGVQPPPSLANIFKEINDELGLPIPAHGNLEHWARQGVLLLNAMLTVRAGQAGSHQGKGWENFTDAVISAISNHKTGVVFLLWGAYAKKKTVLIDATKHEILTSAHPSPLSAYNGFFGNGHFMQTNVVLARQDQPTIDWGLPPIG